MTPRPAKLLSFLFCAPILAAVVGCAASPPPRVVYQDSVSSVRLSVDERTKEPHSHPAHLTTDQMASILSGLRVVSRQGILGAIFSGSDNDRPAFSPGEIQGLAPQLTRALAQAKPDELVTFYRRLSDTNVGLAVTSGGLFVNERHMYVILANNRTLPSAGMNQNMVSTLDPVDSPLLPISRTDFRVTFTPTIALVPADERRPWPYIDEGRIVAVDLTHLARELRGKSDLPSR